MPWRKVIRLLIEDIDRFERFLESPDQDRFINDERAVIAVCYAFVRIGQGVMRLPESIRAARPAVPWKEVRHFRNSRSMCTWPSIRSACMKSPAVICPG